MGFMKAKSSFHDVFTDIMAGQDMLRKLQAEADIELMERRKGFQSRLKEDELYVNSENHR
jgi:hypothetical protein